jgi:hypothetical protein
LTEKATRYSKIIESVFLDAFKPGATEVEFDRADFVEHADRLGIDAPKNLGDVIYSFRFRVDLPDAVQSRAPDGLEWMIRLAGRSKYKFVAVKQARIVPSGEASEIKIPDATPGIIARWALNDEQALLAMLRYNRLIDVFTGITCYSLQNHLRTTAPEIGQVETDEIYIGVDGQGRQYVFPVQAKGGRDQLSVVQIEQDFALCADKFTDLICRPIAAQFTGERRMALFEFEDRDAGVEVCAEKQYRLISGSEITAADLEEYRRVPE